MSLRKPSRRRGMTIDDAIMPLINIVFLLLIFFLVAGRLSSAEPFKVAAPFGESTNTSEEPAPLILVGGDGALALDGAVVTEEALITALALRSAEAPSLLVRLKPDATAKAAEIARLMEALKAAGVSRIMLLTRFARSEPSFARSEPSSAPAEDR